MSARVSWRDHARLYEKTQYAAKITLYHALHALLRDPFCPGEHTRGTNVACKPDLNDDSVLRKMTQFHM